MALRGSPHAATVGAEIKEATKALLIGITAQRAALERQPLDVKAVAASCKQNAVLLVAFNGKVSATGSVPPSLTDAAVATCREFIVFAQNCCVAQFVDLSAAAKYSQKFSAAVRAVLAAVNSPAAAADNDTRAAAPPPAASHGSNIALLAMQKGQQDAIAKAFAKPSPAPHSPNVARPPPASAMAAPVGNAYSDFDPSLDDFEPPKKAAPQPKLQIPPPVSNDSIDALDAFLDDIENVDAEPAPAKPAPIKPSEAIKLKKTESNNTYGTLPSRSGRPQPAAFAAPPAEPSETYGRLPDAPKPVMVMPPALKKTPVPVPSSPAKPQQQQQQLQKLPESGGHYQHVPLSGIFEQQAAVDELDSLLDDIVDVPSKPGNAMESSREAAAAALDELDFLDDM